MGCTAFGLIFLTKTWTPKGRDQVELPKSNREFDGPLLGSVSFISIETKHSCAVIRHSHSTQEHFLCVRNPSCLRDVDPTEFCDVTSHPPQRLQQWQTSTCPMQAAYLSNCLPIHSKRLPDSHHQSRLLELKLTSTRNSKNYNAVSNSSLSKR